MREKGKAARRGLLLGGLDELRRAGRAARRPARERGGDGGAAPRAPIDRRYPAGSREQYNPRRRTASATRASTASPPRALA